MNKTPYRQHRFANVVFLLFLAPAGAAWAQAEEGLYFSDLPVVASVSRLPQPLADAPTAVTVIDRDLIKASGARDLNDLFRLVPGFQTYPNNTDAARVTYHGLTDEDYSPRLQVLIDGRSQYSPLFRNGVNWATLPVALEDIERIEVVRGSNSPSYGSNAFLGVINIITVDPSLVRGVSLSANRGNQGVQDQTVRGGGKLGQAGDFRVTYQEKKDDGLSNRFDWVDSFRSRLMDFRADFIMSDRDVLQLNLGHVEAVTQLGRLQRSGNVIVGGSDPANPIRDYQQSDSYLQLLWRRTLDSNSDFQLRYSYMRDWASEKHTEVSTSFSINGVSNQPVLLTANNFGGVGTRHEVEAQHTFVPFAQTRMVWGTGYRLDSLKATEYLYGREEVNRSIWRLFGNLEWKPLAWFTGNAGLAGERDSLAGYRASQRLGGNFHLDQENTVRIGASRSYRTGSAVDYVGDRRSVPFATVSGTELPAGSLFRRRYLGNPDLPEEKMDTLEIGYLGDWKSRRMSLDVRIFHEKVHNRQLVGSFQLSDPALCQIVFLPQGCTNTAETRADMMVPMQSVDIEGFEYQWRWQPFDSTRLLLNQAFIRINADYLPGLLSDPSLVLGDARVNNDLLTDRSAPRHSTSALWMQKLPAALEFSLAAYWQDRMRWTKNSEVNSYHRVDARLAYPFRLGGQGGEIAYTVQSLNGAHGEFKANGQPADRVVERRQWVSLRLDF